jgi:CubicO group peptidase (beta-lactamase class C family)
MKIHTSCLGSNFEKIVSDAIQAHQPVADSGVAVAVIKNGQLAYAAGFGYRDRATSAPVDACTCFAIGSATKAFTSMAVSMWVDQNKLTLDTPIGHYLTDFQLEDPQATQQATLTDVLSHQTGLAPHNCLWYLGPFNRAGLYYRLRYLQPAVPFRSQFVYNNLMYMVAGYLLETNSGTSYEDIITSSILKPLAMNDTNLSFDALIHGSNYAKGYELGNELALKDFANIGPAAEVNSTALDMATWVQLFLNKGISSGGTVLVTPASLELMYKPIVDAGDGTMYGLGWNITSIAAKGSGTTQQKRLVFHTGDPVGGSAYVSFMPDDALGLVLLTNQHCTTNLVGTWPDKVATDIYDFLINGAVTGQVQLPKPSLAHGLGMAAASAAAAAPPPAAAASTPATSPAAAPATSPGVPSIYAGMYSNDGYGDFAIGMAGRNLTISYYGSSWPMQPITDIFFEFQVPAFGTIFPVLVAFESDAPGGIKGFKAPLVELPTVLMIPFEKR